MRHIQPFSSDFLPSAVLGFTLPSTSKPSSGSVTHVLPLPEVCCFVKPIHWWSVSTDSQPGVLWFTCPMLPTPLWPHYSSHASTEPFRHICTLHFLLLFHVSLLFHWQLNTQQIQINCHFNATHKPLYIYTDRKLGQEHKIHAGYNTKYCFRGEHWNMEVFSTYSGTEDQCNVFMISNGSERNLRQGVVILWFRQCRIQEHHIILWVKNTGYSIRSSLRQNHI